MGYKFTTREELDSAIDLWTSNEALAETTYGDINSWDVNAITDFSELFKNKTTFNSDISNWDVSSGTNFKKMFMRASAFNQDITSWDVSSGEDFRKMFEMGMEYEVAFYQDISIWNINENANLNNFLGLYGSGWAYDLLYEYGLNEHFLSPSDFQGQTTTGDATPETIRGASGNDVLSGLGGND